MSSISDSQRLAAIFRELRRFGPDFGSSANHVNQYIILARSIIQFLDQTSLLPRAARLDDQVAVIARLQDLAYHEPDSGGIPDIARWCVGQWLRLLQQHGENLGALRGLGQAWLLRSQPSLARIQIDEGSSSSGMSGAHGGFGSGDGIDEPTEIARAVGEANSRRHTADYVEARGTLIPATEYLASAVAVAERQGIADGQLLSLAAEAYMSLGNVSYQPANERQFRHALIYLHRASQIPGYSLSPYLQNYLDDYGRLID